MTEGTPRGYPFVKRKAFVSEAVKNKAYASNMGVFERNIVGVYYGTDATVEKIAKQYESDPYGLSAVIRHGVDSLWINSPKRVRKKYSRVWLWAPDLSFDKAKPKKLSQEDIVVTPLTQENKQAALESQAETVTPFTSFDVRKYFFREALQSGAHKIDDKKLRFLRQLNWYDWTKVKNLLGIYYLTDASNREIAEQYGISQETLRSFLYFGTLEIWRNSAVEIQNKYPIGGFRGGRDSMHKNERKKTKKKPARKQSKEKISKNTMESETVGFVDVSPEFIGPVKPNSELSPIEPSKPSIVLESSEEEFKQFANDLALYNLAKRNGWFVSAIRKNLIDEDAVKRLREYFEQRRGKTFESDLNNLSMLVVRFDDGRSKID